MLFSEFKLKAFFRKILKKNIDKIDFIKLIRRLKKYEPGHTFFKNPNRSGSAFSNQDEISKLAVDLASVALLEKGEHISREELENQVKIISCRYDFELHQDVISPTYNIVSHLFNSYYSDNLLISKDKRELKHLPRLKKAREDGLGVVYLINHSSHLDEFLFNLFLEQYSLGLPLFAAGQNMMATPSLEKIFRMGSYVIVRKGASRAYLSTLFNYCQALGELGKQQGIFLEAWSGGARTRDGSLRYPKRLITLQGALASRKDILIQPVVISYNRIPEDLTLSENKSALSWLNGHKIGRSLLKKPWSPFKSSAQGLKDIFGRAYIGLCQAKLLSELKDEHGKEKTELTLDEKVALYSIKEIARDKKIVASQLTARALIASQNKPGLPLLEAAKIELDDIFEYHQRTFNQDPDLEDLVRGSLEIALKDGLKSLKSRKIITRRPLFNKEKLPQVLAKHGLNYYATHADRRLYSPSAKENLVVHGANSMGYALVSFIGRHTLNDKRYNNASLTWYDHRESIMNNLAYERTFTDLFPEHRLPKNVFPTSDHTAAYRKATEVVFSGLASEFESNLKDILPAATALKSFIIATTGFDRITHRLPIQIASSIEPNNEMSIYTLSSPITASELLNNEGGFWILAGKTKINLKLRQLFSADGFKVYLSSDPIGVQLAAALSEVYALYGSYLNLNKSIKNNLETAAFIQQASSEALILALALGGEQSTFSADSPAWMSTLLTLYLNQENHLHNRLAKLALNKGAKALKNWAYDNVNQEEEARALSGYFSLQSAYLTAKHLGLKLPLLEEATQKLWI